MKKKLYIALLFQTLIISTFGITVTTTAPNTGVSKVMTVDNGKVYELNFNADVLLSSEVEINIKELGSTIASQQIYTNGNYALIFTPTSNAITIEFNRINSGTASLQFEVDNIQLKEVISSKLTHEVGIKNYELSDHLGNVRTTVSDKKESGLSKVISANDYYPFGMEARSVSNGEYRYGFNGMEKDDEMTEGNYDFGARIYDSRLARWGAIDRRASEYVPIAPYVYSLNSVIKLVDIDGEVVMDGDKKVEITIDEKTKQVSFKLADGGEVSRNFNKNAGKMIFALAKSEYGRTLVSQINDSKTEFVINIKANQANYGKPVKSGDNSYTLNFKKYNKVTLSGSRFESASQDEYYGSILAHDIIDTDTQEGKSKSAQKKLDFNAGKEVRKKYDAWQNSPEGEKKESAKLEFYDYLLKNYEKPGLDAEFKFRSNLSGNSLDLKIDGNRHMMDDGQKPNLNGKTPREIYEYGVKGKQAVTKSDTKKDK